MASGGGVELGDPERYCAKLVKLDRFRCVFEFAAISDVVIGIGGTGTLMHDIGDILGGKAIAALLFRVTVVGGRGGGGGGGGGMGDAGSKTRFVAFC